VYYLSSHDWNGALNILTIDDDGSTTIDQSVGQVKGADAIGPAVLFAQTGLDGTQQHTIRVTYGGKGDLGGGYLAFFGIVYVSFPGGILADVDPVSSSATMTRREHPRSHLLRLHQRALQ
jgi:hypothetical protein